MQLRHFRRFRQTVGRGQKHGLPKTEILPPRFTCFLDDRLVSFRKSLMSVFFPPAILGPDMATPILWAPGIFWLCLQENLHDYRSPCFKGGGGISAFCGRGGGGEEIPILFFMGAEIFLNHSRAPAATMSHIFGSFFRSRKSPTFLKE